MTVTLPKAKSVFCSGNKDVLITPDVTLFQQVLHIYNPTLCEGIQERKPPDTPDSISLRCIYSTQAECEAERGAGPARALAVKPALFGIVLMRREGSHFRLQANVRMQQNCPSSELK